MLGDLSDVSVLPSPSDSVFAATAGDDMHNSMRGKEAEGRSVGTESGAREKAIHGVSK